MKHTFKRILSFALALMMFVSVIPYTNAAEGDPVLENLTVEGLSGTYKKASNAQLPGTVTWTASTDSVTGNVIIAGSVQGASPNGVAYMPENTTLTLTNGLSEEAILAFNYEISLGAGSNTVAVNGEPITNTGYKEITLKAGETATINLSAGFSTGGSVNGATINMTNVRLYVDKVITTTFLPAVNGSYTVNNVSIAESVSYDNKAAFVYNVTATPDEGYSFAGWYCESEQMYLGAEATTSFVLDKSKSVVPMFVKTEDAVFSVGDARFTDLTAAAICATQGSNHTVVLMKDYLLTGSHVIPSGVTLLVPFNEQNDCYTTEPVCAGPVSALVAQAYRTLTLAEGASVTVNGAISVSAQHVSGNTSGQGFAGSPYGPYGHIEMNEGSSITIENGGALYAWGYITGSGSITANSGAKVYENLQVTDFRGGTASFMMVPDPSNDSEEQLARKTVFPFSQYFVQNIEVPLTLHHGATESAFISIYALEQSNSTMLEFIGSESAMFNIGEGSYIVKDYDPVTDRLNISVGGSGTVSVNCLTVTLSAAGQSMTIDSKMFNLPITNNITININGGTVVLNQDVSFLPGSEVNIAYGATMQVGNGFDVYVYDADAWRQGNFVHNNVKYRPLSYSHSNGYNIVRGEDSLKDVKIDVNGNLVVYGYLYTTEGGANIITSQGTGGVMLGKGAGTATFTNQVTQNPDVGFVDINITSAMLKNGENATSSFTSTADADTTFGDAYVFDVATDAWTKYAVVTFDGNGATGGKVDPVKMQNIMIVYGYGMNDATLPENGFTRANATFIGWNTAADGTGTPYAAGATYTVTGNVTLYAIWEVQTVYYTVTFQDENGNKLSELTTEVEEGGSITLPAVPEKTGYIGYWHVIGIGEHKAGQKVEDIFGDLIIQAGYDAIRYDLFFDANGGCFNRDPAWTVLGAPDGYEHGYVVREHGTPAREGYDFVGWNTKADGSGEAPVFGETILTGDTTYYAQWKAAEYTLTWIIDGVTTTETVAYNTEIEAPANPTKEGNTFTGWEGTIPETMPAEDITITRPPSGMSTTIS